MMKGAGGLEGGSTAIVPDGVRYENPAHGLTITLPSRWSVETKDSQLSAHAPESNCSLLILRQASLVSPSRYQNSVEEQISRKQGFSVHDHGTGTLDGRPAVTMRVSVGTAVEEKLVTARTGFTLYTVITVARDDADTCRADLDRAVSSLHFTH